MDAMTFIREFGIAEARKVAESAGTTYEYFYQIAAHQRNAGTKLARKLVDASEGRLDPWKLMTSTDDAA